MQNFGARCPKFCTGRMPVAGRPFAGDGTGLTEAVGGEDPRQPSAVKNEPFFRRQNHYSSRRNRSRSGNIGRRKRRSSRRRSWNSRLFWARSWDGRRMEHEWDWRHGLASGFGFRKKRSSGCAAGALAPELGESEPPEATRVRAIARIWRQELK